MLESTLPKFVEPSEADRLRSKDRLKDIEALVSTAHSRNRTSTTNPENSHASSFFSGAKPTADTTKSTAISSNSPHQADSCSTEVRIQPVAARPLDSSVPVRRSTNAEGHRTHKREMVCRLSKCWGGKQTLTRRLHYHCIICKTYFSKEYKRVIAHMLKCPQVSNFGTEQDKGLTFISDRKTQTTVDRLTESRSSDRPTEQSGSSDRLTEQSRSSDRPTEQSLSGSSDRPTEQSGSSDRSTEQSRSSDRPTEQSGSSDRPTEQTGSSDRPTEQSGSSNRPTEQSDSSDQPVKDSSADNRSKVEDEDLVFCWDSGTSCIVLPSSKKRKHVHCKHCNLSHTSFKRMTEHARKCKIKHSTVSKCKISKKPESKTLLQAELICPNSGVFLVRKGTQGPAAPVHVRVNKQGWECTVQSCKDMRNFHGGSLNPAYLCEHALACVNRNLISKPDLIDDSINFDSFGESDKSAIITFCKDAKDFGLPVVKQFVPTMVDQTKTSRYIYYSVFSGAGVIKYYSRLRRVLVTYDRTTKTHKCDCSLKSCIHKKIAVLVSQNSSIAKEVRPEDSTDDEELAQAKLRMQYVLEHKKIPLDVSSYMQEVDKTEFSPHETKCHKCDNVELVVLSSHNRGNIFKIEKKLSGIKVVTKHCPTCKMQYRYSEYTEGYFNFNNSSFFTISMMEQGLESWVRNTPISSFLEIMKVRTRLDYNVHLILNAVKAYMAIKDLNLNETMLCNRCGDFPVHLSYDVIRSVCFDVEPTSVGDHQYTSFKEMHNDCCQHDLARGYLDPKSCHFNSNMKNLSVKLSQHLPPLICPKNFGGLAPYTRQLLETDKAEEVRLPLERIEQLLQSKQAYKELKNLCDSLHIETRGGKSQMMTRLIANEGNAEVYSVIRKKFTKITGKSGGILRAFCTHGVCYAHSVHSMNQEHARTSQESLSRGHSPYQPPGTGFTTLDTAFHPLIYCPQTDTKISDTLGTRIGTMYQTHNSPPGHPRELKLCRYTPRTDTNRFQVIPGRFGRFKIFVHFCSFRSFHEPGACQDVPRVSKS